MCQGSPTLPKVLNKRTDKIPQGAVYVGRPSKWGNPFTIGRDGTRKEVIEKYKRYIENELLYQDTYAMSNSPKDILDIAELKGKCLVCWCAPLPCHADILLELANKGR